jgi:7-carboxy-7-deazaguanine synthase
MEIPEIMDRVSVFNCPLIEITGGEPLLQDETPLLVAHLLENGYEVMMETNGSLDISRVDGRCIKIVDIKCPTSGESKQNDLENLKRLNSKDQVKFVIGSRDDFEYAKNIIKGDCPELPRGQILLSPVTGKMSAAKLAEWMLADNLNARLNIQIHKVMWPDRQKGV